MIDGSVDFAETESAIVAPEGESFRDNVQSPVVNESGDDAETDSEVNSSEGDGPGESDGISGDLPVQSSGASDEDPSVPVEVIPTPPENPVPDVPPQEDFSLSDVLDAFASGLSAGSSDGTVSDEQLPPVSSPDPVEQPAEPVVCVGIETFSLSPIESSEGLKGILLDILGPYDTVVTQYRYQQGSNQYYSYVNDIQPDYPWIASAVLFIVLLWSVFRLLGRCFNWMR